MIVNRLKIICLVGLVRTFSNCTAPPIKMRREVPYVPESVLDRKLPTPIEPLDKIKLPDYILSFERKETKVPFYYCFLR